jgi:hypothetical protein
MFDKGAKLVHLETTENDMWTTPYWPSQLMTANFCPYIIKKNNVNFSYSWNQQRYILQELNP